jgi:superfamily II DNA or RNA helicase
MAKNTYGLTPWGKWFVDILDSYKMGERLERGRRYANAGKVLSLDIKGGRVSAKVAGHYRPSYKVVIDFPALKERRRVFELIEEDPALLAVIASGELPESFLLKLKKEGIDLIPKRWGAMTRSCSCPDYGDPCKHMAALYYVLAREIDADPHVLFRLRGIDLSELGGRFGASLDRGLAPPFTVRADCGPRQRPEGPPEIPQAPQCAGLIISLLPASPPFCERDFTLVLAEFYHKAARADAPWEAAGNEEEEHVFSRSRWTIECANPRPGAEPVLIQENVLGEKSRHSVFEAFLRFRSFSSDDGSESYAFLFYLFKFLNLLCAAGAYIPCPATEGDSLRVIWKPFDRLPLVGEALAALARYEDRMLILDRPGQREQPERPGRPGAKTRGARKKTAKAGAEKGAPPEEPVYADGRGVVDLLASALLGEWVRRCRFAAAGKGDASLREMLDLFFQGAALDVASPSLRSLPLAIDRWLAVLHTDFSAWKYRFTVKQPSASAKEDGKIHFNLAMDVILETEKGVESVPLKNAARKTGSIEVLKAPTALSNYLPEIRALGSRAGVRLSEERLVHFLDDSAGLLARLGIEVIFPKSLHRELKPRLVLKTGAKTAGGLVNYFNLESLLEWQWQLAIGDDLVSMEEFEALLKQKRSLVKFKDKFIHIDPAELSALLKKAKNEAQPEVNDFLKSHFAGDTVLSFEAQRIAEKLFEEKNFPVPDTLSASLRRYQERGYNWICSLLLAGFGCILADDMGLGKTVQSIAVLLRLKAEGLLAERCLVVAPAALLENWERELARFAPCVKVSRYHGPGRRLDGENDVFLTTYQTAARDAEKLTAKSFSLLIADEAHLIKNADTRGAKTLKKLSARCRLALSGTPVENRLEDMRSLFDFILPGYLGTPAQFKEAYRVPIEIMRRKDKAETLRKITGPFLLRRLKTDKTIIADLPDKITINEYAALEKDQAALYETIVAATMEKSESLEDPAGRSALVLGLLTALKQICDHPRVYDGESPALSKLSGKAALLVTLLQEILANREKVLIFSQYVKTLECLETIIQKELGEAALMYHGGLTQKTRAQVIDRFQTDPAVRVLLVSLRAGGLGLNLTAASRVIHYDLWYNPAVENQATDRAFRIGQSRNVFVHRFITQNSFEEKIDKMLTDKRELADMSVSSGESWLARMSHEELKALFDR